MITDNKPNVWELLRKKYPANEYVLMEEVSDAAGFNRSNSADFISYCLWPSRGLQINGIELKSFRSDWLRELKKPDKAENIFKYCDYFWLLTTDFTIAKLEEIPETWGWMYIQGKSVKIAKQAPKLNPLPLSKGFVAAMLKRADSKDGFIRKDSISDKIKEAEENAIEISKRDFGYKIKQAEEYISIIKDFEKESGIEFNRWTHYEPAKIGKAVKFIHDGGTNQLVKELEIIKSRVESILNSVNNAVDTLHFIKEPNETS